MNDSRLACFSARRVFFFLLLFREGWGGCLVSFIPNICSRLLINQNQKLLVV